MNNDTVLRSVFNKFDEDQTNSLSYEQFIKLLSRLSKHAPELQRAELQDVHGVFRLLDKNSDGLLSFEEFSRWWQRIDKYDLFIGEKAELLQKAYILYTSYTDGDKMTLDEFSQMMMSLNIPFTQDDYENLDTSVDGQLNFQEFCNWLDWF